MTRWWRAGALGAVVVACVGYLVYSATTSSAEFYQTIPEVRAHPASGQVRVLGIVEDGYQRQGARLSFVATDGHTALPVVYSGSVPDLFQPGIEVVVEGRLTQDGVFHASTLLTKCPSRFVAKNPIASTAAS